MKVEIGDLVRNRTGVRGLVTAINSDGSVVVAIEEAVIRVRHETVPVEELVVEMTLDQLVPASVGR